MEAIRTLAEYTTKRETKLNTNFTSSQCVCFPTWIPVSSRYSKWQREMTLACWQVTCVLLIGNVMVTWCAVCQGHLRVAILGFNSEKTLRTNKKKWHSVANCYKNKNGFHLVLNCLILPLRNAILFSNASFPWKAPRRNQSKGNKVDVFSFV